MWFISPFFSFFFQGSTLPLFSFLYLSAILSLCPIVSLLCHLPLLRSEMRMKKPRIVMGVVPYFAIGAFFEFIFEVRVSTRTEARVWSISLDHEVGSQIGFEVIFRF
jgi:hypothetical protein